MLALRIAASTTLLTVLGLFSPVTASAQPAGDYPVSTPGARLVSTALAQNGLPYQCTLGFVVNGPQGVAALTAGHCRLDPTNSAVLQRTPGGDVVVGRYLWSQIDRGVRDVALVSLGAVPVVPALDSRPITKVLTANQLRTPGMVLCKSGARTGETCGPLTAVTKTTVSFRSWDDYGDSGAPVYTYRPDGSVAAVAILHGHTDDAWGRVVHATLVAPVLEDNGLTLLS